jgi:hypothetical protein
MDAGSLPTKPPTETAFGYIHFDTDKHPFGPARTGSFAEYAERLKSFSTRVVPKDKAPLWVHAITMPQADGRYSRRKADMQGMTALIFDCDSATERPAALLTILDSSGIEYVYQERAGKGGLRYHLTLPLADYPERRGEEDGEQLARRMARRLRATRQWLDSVAGVKHDASFDRPTQGIKPYTRRPGDDALGVEVYHHDACTGVRLDWEGLLAALGHKDGQPSSTKQRGGETDPAALAAFSALKKSDAPHEKGGWYITCPIGHGDDSTSKTWLTPRGRVICMAERCRGLTQGDFERALADPALRAARLHEAGIQVRPAPKRIRLEQAGDVIRAALGEVDVHADVATVLRVTTGAGKTHWIGRFLGDYTAEVQDG